MTLFGTDGVRGRAGEGVLRPLPLQRFGLAVAAAFQERGCTAVAVARDTRESSPWIAANLTSALLATGLDVEALAVAPTPVLAHHVARSAHLGGGIMVTASHNAWEDNGIKLFGGDGGKVDDATQARCEALFGAEPGDHHPAHRGGRWSSVERSAREAWVASFAGEGDALRGLQVVADGASGAGHEYLVEILRHLGAEVIVSDPTPNGRNINDGCGAVAPEALARRVVAEQAHAGVALDGDGDRIMLVDELGGIQDGDAILGALAADGQARGWLRGGAVVGTVATNGGLEGFLRTLGLRLERTAVGDRNVAERMAALGANLGGESSGHVLRPDLCPSGDGARIAIEVLRLAAREGRPLSALLGVVPRFAVEHRKVRVQRRPAVESVPELARCIAEVETELAVLGGRTLVRYSGTEPILRIQVEGADRARLGLWADRIAAAARVSVGGA